MGDKKYFPFYYNWAEMINDSYDDDDKEYAQLLAFAIVRYASTGEIIDLGDRRAQRMFERCLTYGLDSADANYQIGKQGGRPTKLTDADQLLIAEMRKNRKTAKEIAKYFAVSENTILRSNGWKDYLSYSDEPNNQNSQNSQNPQTHNSQNSQNQEEEEEENKEEKEYKEEMKPQNLTAKPQNSVPTPPGGMRRAALIAQYRSSGHSIEEANRMADEELKTQS